MIIWPAPRWDGNDDSSNIITLCFTTRQRKKVCAFRIPSDSMRDARLHTRCRYDVKRHLTCSTDNNIIIMDMIIIGIETGRSKRHYCLSVYACSTIIAADMQCAFVSRFGSLYLVASFEFVDVVINCILSNHTYLLASDNNFFS